jgi:hypothetical protein
MHASTWCCSDSTSWCRFAADEPPRKQPRRRSARASIAAYSENDESMELSALQSWSGDEISEDQPFAGEGVT